MITDYYLAQLAQAVYTHFVNLASNSEGVKSASGDVTLAVADPA